MNYFFGHNNKGLKLFLLLGLLLFASQTTAQRRINKPQKRVTKSVVLVDADSAVASQEKIKKPLKSGSLSKFANKKVNLGKGRKMKLKDISKMAFENQNKFAETIKKKKLVGKAVLRKPQVESEVKEFDDVFMLIQSTKMIVVDPNKLSKASPIFNSYMGKKKTRKASISKLSKKEQAGLRELIKNVESLDPKDPVRLAAAKGEQAVFDAIVAGKGEISVTDTFVIPKKPIKVVNGNVQLPSMIGGALNFNKLTPIKLPITANVTSAPKTIRSSGTRPNSTDMTKHSPVGLHRKHVKTQEFGEDPIHEQKGLHEFTAEFMAGFTLGNAWQWERRWNFSAGFFRITFGAGYGIGVRIPIKMEGTISPTDVLVYDNQDKTLIVETEIKVDTLDADKAFFKRVGVSNDKLFGGDEFVLEFQVGYGYKLSMFSVDVLHKKYQAIKGLHFSQDTKPPFGPKCETCGIDIELDPKLTRTEINSGAIKGSLIAGIHINGNAKILIDRYSIADGKNGTRTTLAFENNEPLKTAMNMGKLNLSNGRSSASQRFGVNLYYPRYSIDIFLIPQLRFGFTLGYKGVSREFKSDWIRLNMFAINLGEIAFGPHKGTTQSYRWENANRKFVEKK